MDFRSFAVLVLLAALGANANVIYEDCSNTVTSYEIDAVQIEGCERSIPCYLTVGKKTNVTVTYTAGFTSNSLRQESHVLLNGIQRETQISPQACQATSCPVRVQVSSRYQAYLELPTNIALNVRGFLNWHIFNEQDVRVICFRVTIQTQTMLTEMLKNLT